jgi:ATP-binding cassette, subfamily B, bacterial MsbA
MKNLFRILKYIQNYKRLAFLNVFFNLLSTVFSLFSLTMIIPFLDLIFLQSSQNYEQYLAKGKPVFELSFSYLVDIFYYQLSASFLNGENGKVHALLFLCLIIVIMFLFKNLFRYLAMYSIAPLRNGIMMDLRNKTYAKIVSLPLSYFSDEKKGDVISRISNDAQEIEWTVLTSLEMLFKDPINILCFLTAMIYWSPDLTLFVFVSLPISGFIIGRVGKSLKETSSRGQSKMGSLISMVEETISGIRIIKAFNAEEQTKNRFYSLNLKYKNLMVKMYRKRDLASPMSEFFGVIVMVLVIWYGGNLILSGESSLKASEFIAYIALFSQLIPPVKSFTTAYYHIQKGAASEERINEILLSNEKIHEQDNPLEIKEFQHHIQFKNVCFSYESEKVLSDIELNIKKGTTLALVGASGSGKSTLVDLIPRFYDPTEGEVLIDGISLKELSLKSLRNLLGIVSQDSILFNDTIFNNIAFGKSNATMQDVEEAARIANADEFIESLDNQYNFNIGDDGNKLSGGQKQRISIARAILKNPPILILDEATSALDTESEKLVQDAINNLMKNRTVIVIAHRLSTIQNADEIIVLEQGKIIERGAHHALLALNGTYKKLYDMQGFD